MRKNFIDCAEKIDPKNLIFIDESGANLGMANEYARSEGGTRALSSKPFNQGEKFSIISAISITGIVAMMYIASAVNATIFKAFVNELLIPKLKLGQFVILDNVSFHKSPEIIAMINATGAKIVFLPPYSPDLSPIEKMWSKIKDILKRKKPRTKANFHQELAFAISEVNETDCEEWYESCGYSIAA